ncbi:MAG: PilZ domain-containing protein [Planctomycetota bacterium]|nr:PilZ domain-containing protein [Planctomycetota bacterium]
MAKLTGDDRKLGEILLHRRQATAAQLEAAAGGAKQHGMRLGAYLVAAGDLTPEQLRDALALLANLPTVDLEARAIPDEYSRIFPYRALKDHRCVPFEETPGYVCLAVAEPLKPGAVRELEYGCRRAVKLFVAREDHVEARRDRLYRGRIPRKFSRFRARIPVSLQFCTRIGSPIEDEIRFVTTLDISQGGLAVMDVPRVPVAISEAQPSDVYADVTLQDPEHEVRAVCQVRWIREQEKPDQESHRFQAGLEIVEIKPAYQQALLALCVKASKDAKA